MPFNVGFATDIGMKRKKNQDAGAVYPEIGLFIVADGMGGHRGGEIASAIAVESIASEVKKLKSQSETDCKKILTDAIQLANRAIYAKSVTETELQGMGTTAIAILFDGYRLYIGHVGDSRAYFVRNDLIWQLTKDHSFVQEKMRAGLITREQAKHDQTRNVITRSVGFGQETLVEVYEYESRPGDIFLICSDGLSGQVEDLEILSEIQNAPKTAAGQLTAPEEIVKQLIQRANQQGGQDNITVALVQVA